VAQRLGHAGDWLRQNPTESFPWLQKLPAFLTNQLNIHSEQVKARLTEAGQRAVTVLAGVGTVAAQRLFDMVLEIAVLVFCLFYMFRDGKKMHAQLQTLIPLSVKSKNKLSATTQRTIVRVVRGTVLMSMAQTAMMAVGLLVVRADAIVLLCFLTFAATFIPSVGTALISIPAAIYFFAIGVQWKGVFFLIWGLIGMGILDSILRPFLVGAGEEMSFFWLVFAVLGGLEAFGLKGLLLGPLILSLMPVVLEIYRDRYLDIPED
jgi:predicted PurR-regulated permease PerM